MKRFLFAALFLTIFSTSAFARITSIITFPTASGNDTYIQFNDGGVVGSSGTFTFTKVNDLLTVSTISASTMTITYVEVSSIQINGVYYEWPSADGSASQSLFTDGSNSLSWETMPSGVAALEVIANDVQISSPTKTINFSSNFSGTLVGVATSSIDLNALVTSSTLTFSSGTITELRTSSITTGFLLGVSDLEVSINGTDVMNFESSWVTARKPIRIPDGDASLGGVSFNSAIGTNIHKPRENTFGIAAGGALVLDINTTSTTVRLGDFHAGEIIASTLTVTQIDASSVAISGTLDVDGITTLIQANISSANISGTLDVDGISTLVQSNISSASISGTLDVDGITTLIQANISSATVSGTLDVDGDADFQGTVTKPLQPSFSVAHTAGDTDVTGNGAAYTIVWAEGVDIGGNFASNTFTSPVTGIYQLCSGVFVKNVTGAGASMTISFVTSNRTYTSVKLGLAAGNQGMNFCILADMDASDTVTVRLTGTGEAGDVWDMDNSNTSNFFMGSLKN